MPLQREIWVTFQVEGFHHAPLDLHLNERYLELTHRHLFHFKVTVSVFHNDRDVEFIELRRFLRAYYQPEPVNFGMSSCEKIAEELLELVQKRHPGRQIRVEVSEDGENGCVIATE